MDSILQEIQKKKIITIIRSNHIESIDKIVESLYTGGIRIIEITMNTPDALQKIEEIKKKFPDVCIGAGTVLDGETARLAILSGASFLLTPALSESVIKVANRYNVPVIPGVFTPTEILKAYELGAKVVKIFPVGTLGPKYIKELKGPFSHIDMVPVGGVTVDTISDFLKAGSFAFGIGSSMVNDKLVVANDYEEIERRAKEFVAVISQFNETNDKTTVVNANVYHNH